MAHFGTDEYWENETRDLEELVDRIVKGEDLLTPSEREEAAVAEGEDDLTNKDFFWDL